MSYQMAQRHEDVMGHEEEREEETLAQRVKRLRQAKELSMDTFARLVGVTKNQVSLVEKGQTKMLQPFTLQRYSEVLGVSEEYLRRGFELPPRGLEEWPDLETWARARGELRDESHIQFLLRTYNTILRMERDGDGSWDEGDD